MISVVIPHFNQPTELRRCLTSLQGQAAGGHDVEIVVVDNGSREMPEAVVAEFSGVRLVQELAKGPGPARNFGVTLTGGEILAFIDADCVAAPSWLSAIAARFAADAKVVVLGGYGNFGARICRALAQDPAERVSPVAIAFANRASDFLFVAGRSVNDNGKRDVLWVPGKNR